MKIFSFYIKLLFILLLPLAACNTSKQLQENEYLLNKNIIKPDNKNINTEELEGYIKQKSNRKILGVFKFHLGVYSFANKGKETKIKKWLKNTIGEPPVILDTTLTNSTLRQFKLYLNNKGYFNSNVTKTIKYKKKKTNVWYNVQSSKPYTIRNINYSIQDPVVSDIELSDKQNSEIKTGDNYDIDILQKERKRITNKLKNEGFYNFSKEFINYTIDSALNNNQLDILLNIKNQELTDRENPDSVIIVNHKRYTINNIYIYPDYNSLELNTKYDSLIFYAKKRSSEKPSDLYYFLYKDKLKIKPKTIIQSVFISKNNYFQLEDVSQTYKNLSELHAFKFINIKFADADDKDSIKDISDKNFLDCRIQLTKLAKQSFNIEAEGTNSAGNLGVAGNIIYQNRNIFKGAEILSIKLKGAMEVQKIFDESSSSEIIQSSVIPFNTIETGINASINIPKFFIPVKQEKISKYFKPKTIINTGFNYQRRPDYTRYITNVSFGYKWKEFKLKTHIFNPIEINSVKIFPDSAFAAKINASTSAKTKNSYSNHLTLDTRYSFIFNNQQINKQVNFIYFRGNIEFAGNTLNLLSKLTNKPKDEDGTYSFFNIKYAQYIRVDADFRYYNIINKLNTLAFRFYSGIGIPYNNMDILPFEKSFFCGGANSIRAWKIRSLGPGAYLDTSQINRFDKTGDIIIETNIEYRFPIYKDLQGATFLDAGNVWLTNKNSSFPEGDFQFDRFFKEIAIGIGLGFRFDFNFFIIRFDAAVPIRDPSKIENERWVINDINTNKINFNFGIGYPF